MFKTVLKDRELRQFTNNPTLQKEHEFNKNQTTEKLLNDISLHTVFGLILLCVKWNKCSTDYFYFQKPF